MIFKSIRWRLQLWYGLLLFGALAGLGIAAYQLERNRQLRSVDEELQRRMSALTSSLQSHGRGFPPPGPRFPDRAPPDQMDDGPPPDNGPPRNFKLVPGADRLFGGDGPAPYYFFIHGRDGSLLAQSTNAPPQSVFGMIEMETKQVNNAPYKIEGKSAPFNKLAVTWQKPSSGSFRDLPFLTPPGEFLLVGRSLAPEMAELNHFAVALGGIGGLVLLLGLAGGWLMTSRAIRPIEDISSTAVKIAAGDLSQRIDVDDTENELGRLASVLNSTFARLEAAFAQQGQFTADAAHELRTPVTVILMQTQTALKHPRDAGEYRGTVEACQRAAQRMRRLLESLLELTRLDAGQEPMKRFQFDLARTVGDCVELLQPLAVERGIKIQSDLPPLETIGDPERLVQVFTNLLTNAIHYNKDGGEVRVSVQRQNNSALVTVADNGQGISAEDLPRVFERFYRADKARSGAAVRNGLGLAISKAIVEAHGGAIEVTSELGKGATFVVRLPLVDGKS